MQKEEQVSFLAEKIRQADAVLIGGGSGLSSAAGYNHYHWLPYICLLYTSPSPRDRSVSRMPSSA